MSEISEETGEDFVKQIAEADRTHVESIEIVPSDLEEVKPDE